MKADDLFIDTCCNFNFLMLVFKDLIGGTI